MVQSLHIQVPDEHPSSYDLVTNVIAHINQSNKDDHKIEIESIVFTSDTTTDAYIKCHLDIRQKKVAAKYPGISEEETTVESTVVSYSDFILEVL